MNCNLAFCGAFSFLSAAVERCLLNGAISHGDVHWTEQLISSGVRFELEDEDGNRAIHKACQAGTSSIVNLLIDYNCKLEARNKARQTPMHIVCIHGYLDILKVLVENECELEPRDRDDKTPLQLANSNGNILCALHLSRIVEERNNAIAKTMVTRRINEQETTKDSRAKLKMFSMHQPRQPQRISTDEDIDPSVCPVCRVHKRNCVINCNHTFCVRCVKKMKRCVVCKVVPTNVRQILIN